MESLKGSASDMTEALDRVKPAWARSINANQVLAGGSRVRGKTFMVWAEYMKGLIAERIAFNLSWLKANPNGSCMIAGSLVDFAKVCDVKKRNDQSEYMTILGMRVFVSGLVDPKAQCVVLNSHAAKTYIDVIDPEFYVAVKEQEDAFRNR